MITFASVVMVILSQDKAKGNLPAANAALLRPVEDGLTLKINT
jgi:hypothetical protein